VDAFLSEMEDGDNKSMGSVLLKSSSLKIFFFNGYIWLKWVGSYTLYGKLNVFTNNFEYVYG